MADKKRVYVVSARVNGKPKKVKVRASSAWEAQNAVLKKYGSFYPGTAKRAVN